MPSNGESREYVEAYRPADIRRISVSFNAKQDPEIVSRLDSVSNLYGYIRKLIRDDCVRERRRKGIRAMISLDGGAHFLSPEEALPIIDARGIWTDVLCEMDPTVLVRLADVHIESRLDFLRLYLSLSSAHLILD